MTSNLTGQVICLVTLLAISVALHSLRKWPPLLQRARRALMLSGAGLVMAFVAFFVVGFPTTEGFTHAEAVAIGFQFSEPRDAAATDDRFRSIPFEILAERIADVDQAYGAIRDSRIGFAFGGLVLFLIPMGFAWSTLNELRKCGRDEPTPTTLPRVRSQEVHL